jgi:hypothetical protein
MSYRRILYRRIVSPDGKSVAEAYSEAIASSEHDIKISQTITFKVDSDNSSSCSSTSSSSSRARM